MARSKLLWLGCALAFLGAIAPSCGTWDDEPNVSASVIDELETLLTGKYGYKITTDTANASFTTYPFIVTVKGVPGDMPQIARVISDSAGKWLKEKGYKGAVKGITVKAISDSGMVLGQTVYAPGLISNFNWKASDEYWKAITEKNGHDSLKTR